MFMLLLLLGKNPAIEFCSEILAPLPLARSHEQMYVSHDPNSLLLAETLFFYFWVKRFQPSK